ncbi:MULTISPECIES: TetR/AcrR family transcriptional regulator [unclassified Bacillus (in: firmicutes)]|uniref:TetR/AcrR family transcriptional regulator n=1 Tax=unclassified Bacillus (in: firmicutes) TaxID=185979 RepID=UPI0008E27F64|nr:MULTISPECIES: TetR/AcrR family transcriptional regulator [unclassified Bacillus (in: firmicutes)]SFB03124.1 DNA-binding transcriptional regulator, AcrR family [Bacillus sp. UNCCL13]SFQ88874.1 DNA-binding transcriptional regulator, AcrR family [Bacillus sp. cl95]
MFDQEFMLQQLFAEDENLTERQKRILAAAIESFSEKGFAATSTSEIAKKAGVAEGTIFKHFKTKKDLLMSIVAPMMARLIAPFIIRDLNKVLDQQFENVEDFLRAMILNRQEFLVNNIQIIRILLQEIPFQPELREQFKEHVAKQVFERFEILIEHYQKKGQLIEMPTFSAVRLAASSIFGFLIARYLIAPEMEWDDEAEVERTIHFIMHGLASPKN